MVEQTGNCFGSLILSIYLGKLFSADKINLCLFSCVEPCCTFNWETFLLLLTEHMAGALKRNIPPNSSSLLSLTGIGHVTSPYRLSLNVTPHDCSRCTGMEIFRIATSFLLQEREKTFISDPTSESSALDVFIMGFLHT